MAVGEDILDRCTIESYFRANKTASGVERHEYAGYAERTSRH
jgi:hypothetical protein